MDLSEETEVKENECVQSSSANRPSVKNSDKSDKRKAFFGLRRRGSSVLAELETISENNAINDNSFHSRGNLSFNPYISAKRKPDRLSQSFTHSSRHHNENSQRSIDNQPLCSSKSTDLQTTPPTVLRQRIKDAHEVRYYLEKELSELQEFTTTEKQILAVEKGYESLREEKMDLEMELSNLQEQNSNLQLELEEMTKLNNSQKDLIADLKENFDEVKAELKNLEFERGKVLKELSEMKNKLLDEEFKNEISESKWNKREDELKKSLEEAWMLLRNKEDRLQNMNDNIKFLYSEREVFTSFNKSMLSLTTMDKMKTYESKVEELFKLSCFSNDDKQKIPVFKCNCKGDSAENEGNFENEILMRDLKKCREELENLNKKMKEQEKTIDHFNDCLNELESSFEFHVDNSNESDILDHSLCNADHVSMFDKISCELLHFKQTLLLSKTPESQGSVVEVQSSNKEICQSNTINSSITTNNHLVNSLALFPHECGENNTSDVGVIDSTSHITERQAGLIIDNSDIVKNYEEKIKILEDEILNYKNQLEQMSKTSLQKDSRSGESNLNLSNVETQYDNKLCKGCQIQKATKLPPTTYEVSSLGHADTSSQTTLDFISLQQLEEKINKLESIIPCNQKLPNEYLETSSQTTLDNASVQEYEEKIHNLELFIADSHKSSIEQAVISSQTLFDYASVQEYEEKINKLEAIIADTHKHSIEQADISSQTTLDFASVQQCEQNIDKLEASIADSQKLSIEQADNSSPTAFSVTDHDSVQEYEEKVNKLEAIIADTHKHSIEQTNISPQTTLDFVSVQQYEQNIDKLEAIVADTHKPSIEQADISSQTTLDASAQEYEAKINKLEVIIADTHKLSIEQVDISSQTTFDYASIQEYEEKINKLEAIIADSHKPSIEQADISSQTTLDFASVQQYEEKIDNLETIIVDSHKPSIEQADISSQTAFDYASVQEYEEKINKLEAIIADTHKPSIEQADISSQTTLDFASIQQCEQNIDKLEASIADSQKLSIEQADNSSPTASSVTDHDSVQEYEEKVNKLEAIIADTHNSSVEQDDISSQIQSCNVSEALDNVRMNPSNPHSVEYVHSSCQTEVTFVSIEEYEDKIINLQSLIADKSKFSNNQADLSSQAIHHDSFDECQEKIINFVDAKPDCNLSPSMYKSIDQAETLLSTPSNKQRENKLKNFYTIIGSNCSFLDSSETEMMQHSIGRVQPICQNPTTGNHHARVSLGSNQTINQSQNHLLDLTNDFKYLNILQSGTEGNPMLGEFIELPAPDTSVLDFTFNHHLEHSILKSKLRTADTSTGSETYDPLGSVSEEFGSNRISPKSPISFVEELAILKEQCKTLDEELKLRDSQNNKSLSLIKNIENLLMPSNSCNLNDTNSKLERIIQCVNEVLKIIEGKNIEKVGVLNLLKIIHSENIELNKSNTVLKHCLQNMNDSLGELKSLKDNFSSLEKNVKSLKDVDTSFINLSNKLVVLYDNLGIYNNESKENLNNLLCENRQLKEELLSLKLLNSDLKNTSLLYDDLLVKYSELQSLLDEKEITIELSSKLKTTLSKFINKIKELKLVKMFCELDNLDFIENNENSDNCFHAMLLLKVQEFLEKCHDSYKLFENVYDCNGKDFFNCIEKLCKDRKMLDESCTSLKSKLLAEQDKLSSLLSVFTLLKNDFNVLSSEVLIMKDSFKTHLLLANQEIAIITENQLEHLQKLQCENQNLKSKITDLELHESVNEKYSELLKTYKHLESELLIQKSDCSNHLKQNESLKSNLLQIESENNKLKEQVNLFESENNELVIKLNNLESLIPINDKYSELVKSYECLEKELLQKNEECKKSVQLYDSLKLTASQTDLENVKLKEFADECRSELSAHHDKVKRLENVELELEELSNKLSNIESEYSNLLLSSKDLENKLKEKSETCCELEQALESLKSSISDTKTNNEELTEKVNCYELQIEEYSVKLKILEKLETENNDLKNQLEHLKSLSSVNDKYSQLLQLYEELKGELLLSNKNNSELSLLHNEFKMKYSELEIENNNFKNDILKYQNDVLMFKKSLEDLELKYVDREKEIKACHEQHDEKLKEFNSFMETHNILKKKNESFVNMANNLRSALKVMNSQLVDFEDTFWNPEENDFQDIFSNVKELMSELFELRKSLIALQSSFTEISEEKNELINNVETLKEEIKTFQEEMKLCKDEITELQQKQESNQKLKEEINKYNDELTQVLSSLNYPGEVVPSADSWMFIKQKIASCNGSVVLKECDLERKISDLESQLLDTDHFKRKFSRELHGLKPELKISDLMKLSLEDLQITMISTIMEKESAVVANLEKDYEMKLALSSDRIHQLEEEERRRIVWISEIENENDRLLSECKQIQEENKNLKHEITTKIEKIETLERQIEEEKIKVSKSMLVKQENEKHELEELEKEKSFFECNIQEAVSDLNRQLDEKSKECGDALSMLQSKSESIFQLEKIIFDVRSEKVHLEEEIKSLKETLSSQLNTFEEAKKQMEQDISHYKAELSNMKEAMSSVEEYHKREKLDLQREIETKVFLIEQLEKLGNEADLVINHKIGNMLESHSLKVDNLNMKIKELRHQLNGQNNKFTQIESQESLVENLKSEINDLKATIISFEKEKSGKNNSDSNIESKKTEEIILDEVIKTLQIELDKTKKELCYVQEERNAFFQDSVECHQLKEKVSILSESLQQCQDELEQCKNELHHFKDENNKLQEQSLEYEQCKNELNYFKNENNQLQNQSQKYEHLNKEFSILSDDLKQYKDKLDALQKEKESLLNLPTDLTAEVSRLENEVASLCNEKEVLKKELCDNLQFEKDLRNSLKLELTKKENEILSLKKDRDTLIQDHVKNVQIFELEIKNLKDKLLEAGKVNNGLQDDLLRLNKIIDEKNNCLKKLQSELEEIKLNFHAEEFCPYKKDSLENKSKIEEFNELLTHERETFKLWKTNLEEDLHCKVLKIGDLESKLKKETQSYKEAMSFVSELQHSYKEAMLCISELQQKLSESEEKSKKSEDKLKKSEEKLKKLEDKITMQREVFIREKSKLELEVKNKDKFESKIADLKSKSEELASSINTFLEKVASLLKKDIPDLGSAFNELLNLNAVLEEEKEKSKQLDEDCEELEKNRKYLENELGKLYAKDISYQEILKCEKSKLREEQEKNEKLLKQILDAQVRISSLQADLESMERQLLEQQKEKKLFEVNIQNLLEDKHKLQGHSLELEKKVSHLQAMNEKLQNKDNAKGEELLKELNYLKLQIVHKDTKISKLEMRLESDCLPFQRRAEAAERKIEELSKELKSAKIALNCRETSGVNSPSTRLNVVVDAGPSKIENEHSWRIASLEEEIRKLEKEKKALKQLAVLRHKENKELKLELRNYKELDPST